MLIRPPLRPFIAMPKPPPPPPHRPPRFVPPPAVEAVHRDAEAPALTVHAAEHRVGRHPNPVEHHLRRWLCVPAHLLLVSTETQPRTTLFDDERRYSARAVG